jgi:hypothetical protein
MPSIGLVETQMTYMLMFAAVAVAGLIWLVLKSRQLTDAKSVVDKQRAAARAQFLKGSAAGLIASEDRAPAKRPIFGQR